MKINLNGSYKMTKFNQSQPQTLRAFARKHATTDAALAKREDAEKVRPEILRVKDGFNVRGLGLSEAEYWAQPKVVEHVEGLCKAYMDGDYVPPIVVKFDVDKQDAVIVDGHHRYYAIKLAIERGAPIQYVHVRALTGDDSNSQLLMLQSNNSIELTGVEKAEVINRLVQYGFTPDQIASKINKSVPYVNYMLKVYELPIEDKRLIQQGKLTINRALQPKDEKLLTKKRKANRKIINKVIDQLFLAKSVQVNAETNVAQIEIPLELWQKFIEAQAENSGQEKEDQSAQEKEDQSAEAEFMKNQAELDLSPDETTETAEPVEPVEPVEPIEAVEPVEAVEPDTYDIDQTVPYDDVDQSR